MVDPPAYPTIARVQADRPPAIDLSHAEALSCLDIIQRCQTCTSQEVLVQLISAAGELLEADHSACLVASFAGPGQEPRILLVDASSPRGWLPLYSQQRFHLVDPIVQENFSRFQPQYWAHTYRKRPPPKLFRSRAEDFGLCSGLSAGLPSEGGGSLFSFSGPRVQPRARNFSILHLLLPHLHRALCALEPQARLRLPLEPLSERELEVLKWTGAGKSSWEIGLILRISERTVNFHVCNAMKKLDAVNRGQALAVALSLGLLELR